MLKIIILLMTLGLGGCATDAFIQANSDGCAGQSSYYCRTPPDPKVVGYQWGEDTWVNRFNYNGLACAMIYDCNVGSGTYESKEYIYPTNSIGIPDTSHGGLVIIRK